jgi:hypothetical protein
LVERTLGKGEVGGSTPPISTTLSKSLSNHLIYTLQTYVWLCGRNAT